MKTKAKAMQYALDITRRVPTSEAMSSGGAEDAAKILKGTWIKLNPELFAFVEESQTTVIEITKDTRGCGCKAFTDSSLPLLCEHLIAFDDLKEPPQLMIYNDQKICRVLTEYLFTLGWSVEPDHWLYPSLDSPAHIDAGENNIDDADAKTPIDENPASKTSSKADKSEMVHWKCPKCSDEFDVEKSKLTDLKLNHMEVCKGKLVSKKRTQPAKKKTPATKSVDATSDPEKENKNMNETTAVTIPEQQTDVQTTESRRGFLTAAVSIDDAIAAFDMYGTAKTRLLGDGDILYIGAGGTPVKKDALNAVPYIKKSGWRKMARFFGLSVDIIGREKIWTEDAKGNKYYLWAYQIKVSHQCGAYVISEGVCSSRDKFFTKGGKIEADEKNVMLKAQTVGINRGISDLLGAGEVSAEEIE